MDLLPKILQDMFWLSFSILLCKLQIFQAKVFIRLRSSVLDPAGEASRAAASKLGIRGIEKLRIGKIIDLEIEAKDETEAKKNLELLSDKLLANTVIEDWSLELSPKNPN